MLTPRAACECQEPAVNPTADCWPCTSPNTHDGCHDLAGVTASPSACRVPGRELGRIAAPPQEASVGRQTEHTGADTLCKRCLGDSSRHDSKLLLPIPTTQQPGRTPEQGKSVQFFRQGEKSAPTGTRACPRGGQLSPTEIRPPCHADGITAANSHFKEEDEEACKPKRAGGRRCTLLSGRCT